MEKKTYPNRYKKKLEHVLPHRQFLRYLEKAKKLRQVRRDQKGDDPRFKDINIAGLLACLYYTGLRVTEIVGDIPHEYELPDGTVKTSKPVKGITKEDIRVVDDCLRIHAPEVRKRGERHSPLWIPLDQEGIDEILETWRNTEEGERLWPVCRSMVWKLCKQIDPEIYPHYFRLNRATRFAEHPDTGIKDLKDWFGWKRIKSAEPYMEKGGKRTKRMAYRMRPYEDK